MRQETYKQFSMRVVDDKTPRLEQLKARLLVDGTPVQRFIKGLVPRLTVCAPMSGCVGVSVQSTKTEGFQNPRLADEGCIRGLSSHRPNEKDAPDYTAAWLESH